jgi:hypothetical protein
VELEPARSARASAAAAWAVAPSVRWTAGAGAERQGPPVSTLEEQRESFTAVEAISGLLAMASIVLSAIGAGLGLLLELEAHPARVIPVALVLALVAARMSDRFRGLALAAVVCAMVAWVVGMTLAVITESPLI